MKKEFTVSELIAFLICILITSCVKPTPDPAAPALVTITTNAVTAITNTTAVAGGKVTNNGNTSVTEKGICYNTSGNPTINDSKIVSSSSTDTFTIPLANLTPNTNYFARAFAKNSVGLAYGNEVSFRTGSPLPVVIDTAVTIYLSGGRTKDLIALNAQTGAIKWRKTLPANVIVSPIYTNGKVIVGAADNKLYAYDTLGNPAWTATLGGVLDNQGSNAGPIADNGVVYVADAVSVYAFNGSTGAQIWRFQETGAQQLVLRNNIIYCQSNYLYAIDANTGTRKWRYFSNGGSTPVVYDNRIYYLGDAYTINVIDANTGAFIWNHQNWDVFSEGSYINMKYGYIYCQRGGVRSGTSVSDSSTAAAYPFAMPYNLGYIVPPSVSPILADSFAITPYAAYNAFNGTEKCSLPHYEVISGITYASGSVYYLSGERDVYDPYTGAHYYGDAYGFDVKNNYYPWHSAILNTNFFGVEPCVVTKSGTTYRGGYSFK